MPTRYDLAIIGSGGGAFTAAEARHVAADASSRFPGIATAAGAVNMESLIGGIRIVAKAYTTDASKLSYCA